MTGTLTTIVTTVLVCLLIFTFCTSVCCVFTRVVFQPIFYFVQDEPCLTFFLQDIFVSSTQWSHLTCLRQFCTHYLFFVSFLLAVVTVSILPLLMMHIYCFSVLLFVLGLATPSAFLFYLRDHII